MFKRKRIYAPKRTSVKRRRFARRRRPYGRRTRVRANAMSNNHRAYGGYAPASRKMRPRVYRNLLWRNTQTMPRVNSRGIVSATLASPADTTHYRFVALKCFDNCFAVANMSNPDGVEPTAWTGKIIMRGGLEQLQFNTEADECMDMQVALVWVKHGCTKAADTASIDKSIALSTWTSTGDTLNEGTRLMRKWKFNLTRGQGNYTLEYKPKIKAYDIEYWNAGTDCMYWYIWVGSTVSGSSDDNVTYVKAWNCTVAAHWKIA